MWCPLARGELGEGHDPATPGTSAISMSRSSFGVNVSVVQPEAVKVGSAMVATENPWTERLLPQEQTASTIVCSAGMVGMGGETMGLV